MRGEQIIAVVGCPPCMDYDNEGVFLPLHTNELQRRWCWCQHAWDEVLPIICSRGVRHWMEGVLDNRAHIEWALLLRVRSLRVDGGRPSPRLWRILCESALGWSNLRER